MKQKIYSLLFVTAGLLLTTLSKAQTAMDFNKADCNGTLHSCFGDLDAGKAVILHFYMPSCGSCPPPAQKIQAMANNILANHPGTITAYAFPFEDVTLCSYSQTWVSSNGLSLYAPMDSGATQVAYYGGFGMPTVVLLGGTNHRVMFSTQAFTTSDTLIMRDSILGMLGVSPNGLTETQDIVNNINIYPSPSVNETHISFELKEASSLKIDVLDITGKIISTILDEKQSKGMIEKSFQTQSLTNGLYLIRIQVDGKQSIKKFSVTH